MLCVRVYSIIFMFVLALKLSHEDLITHRGKEFIISFISQGPFVSGTGGENIIDILAFENVTVRIQVPALPQQWYQYHIQAGIVKTISLPGTETRMAATVITEKKGIRISASKPISVYARQMVVQQVGELIAHVGEGFLGLPVEVLGKYYVVPTYPPSINSVVQVTAKEDNTKVSFILKLPKHGRVEYKNEYYTDGMILNVTLNALEVFQMLGDSDLTGTIVMSTKPIAVFSGDDYVTVLSGHSRNQLVEQVPPVSVWGERFIASPTPANMGRDEFHILASKDNTDLVINGRLVVTLGKGEKHTITSNKTLVISTTNPSLVVQYTSGQKSSASMSLVPARKWASNDYLIYVVDDGYMNIVIDTTLRGDLRINGPLRNVAKNWMTYSGGFSTVSLHLNQSGVYHIFHKSPLANFTSVVYGNTSKLLFSFPAGLKWELEKSASCLISQTSGGDKVDNDCDGVTDEELANGKDDDGDGAVDEDLASPAPNVTMPRDFTSPPLLACHRSSNVADPKKPGFFPTLGPDGTQGMCAFRGEVNISSKDTMNRFADCLREFDRVWTVEDACENKLTHNQRIRIITPEDPVLSFPKDVTLFCRAMKYLAPRFTGEVIRDPDVCKRNVTIIQMPDKKSGDCFSGEAKLERTWIVKDKCQKDEVKTQVINLVPIGSKRTTNYETSFKITNETFSSELTIRASSVFQALAASLEDEMESVFRTSKLGMSFVEAKVLGFRNGSVIAVILVKMDMQTQVDQRLLFNVMNDTLSRGALGRYEVDPSSLQLQDFDECRSRDLNKCHEKATCTNTVGSYNCTCMKGYVGDGFLCQAPPSIYYSDPSIVSGIQENVTLKCHARGLPEPTFIWIAPSGDVINASRPIFEIEVFDDDSQKTRGKILQKDGSLLVFDTRVHDSGIYKCVAENALGKDEGNVNLTVRKDIVEVDVAITLEDEIFDEELENKSSERYQKMAKEVEQELTALFQDIEGFQRVDILGFVNGSVKVRFRVVVKVDKSGEEEPLVIAKKVGKTLSVNVKNGKIGSLKVKPKIELREVPPPPVNLGSNDVTHTEALITWSHPELYEMYAISGYSLQYKKFGSARWAQFVFTGGVNHMLRNLEHDTAYLVRLKAKNKFGWGIPSENLELLTKKKTNAAELALAVIIPLLLLAILAIVAVFVYRRWKKKRRGYEATDEAVPMNPIVVGPQNQAEVTNGRFLTFGHDRYAAIPGEAPNGASAMAAAASFSWREIARERVTLGKILGEGEFGMVLKGEFSEDDGHIVLCAVKKLKRAATEGDFKDLLNELEIMTSVGNHPNLINLIGACSVGGPLMILVEFAEHGNLLRYLRDHKKQNYDNMNEYTLEISAAERLRIACDVSDGMKHLATAKCAHRDLAARNVLLGEGLVAKVSDFGLSRDIYTDNVYEKKTGGKLPAKWMALESLEQGIYTSQSDVWSFGVLLWEIETGGLAPYAGMVVSELLNKLKEGSRLEKPRYCSDVLYSVMCRCWNANPKKRPTFDELKDELHGMHRQATEYFAPEDFRLEPNYVNTSVENISTA